MTADYLACLAMKLLRFVFPLRGGKGEVSDDCRVTGTQLCEGHEGNEEGKRNTHLTKFLGVNTNHLMNF